jgi:hypothetical protein
MKKCEMRIYGPLNGSTSPGRGAARKRCTADPGS